MDVERPACKRGSCQERTEFHEAIMLAESLRAPPTRRSPHNFLLITPQLYQDAIVAGHLQPSQVNLLVLDECHHCLGSRGHPFVDILELFAARRNESAFRVLGLCPGGVRKRDRSETARLVSVRHLARRLTAVIITPPEAMAI